MEEKLKLDYFYGNEPDRFSFYRIPKVLFTKAFFEKLSTDAKILYGLMLDMMSYSRANRWVDKDNRVYIQFTLQRAMAYLNCGKDKAIKLFAELDSENGIGLIERVSRGSGRTDLIYVKSFEIPQNAEDNARLKKLKVRKQERTSGPLVQKFEKSGGDGDNHEVGKIDRFHENTGASEAEVVGLSDRSDYSTSRVSRPAEVGFSDPNKNNYNNTLFSPVDISVSSSVMDKQIKKPYDRKDDRRNLREGYLSYLRSNVRYDELMRDGHYSRYQELIDGLLNMIADLAAYPKPCGTEWINGREIEHSIVKSKLLKTDYDSLTYALMCLDENTTKIRNKRAYLLTTLYNAMDEKQFGYIAMANYDMHGGGWEEKGIFND